MSQYYMPTKVIMGEKCIVDNSHLLKPYGNKAMIVTGRRSAKLNGSQDEVILALEAEGIDYIIYDKVMSNPTIECAYEGAELAKAESVDFIIAIGGGSPIDGAKAMALLAKQDIEEEALFSGSYASDVLPLIAVPTTAGTGSEVTQYSILTNDKAQTKSGLATPLIFPQIAFMDARYMMSLSVNVTINTGIDALSHAVEGLLSVKASPVSNALALKSTTMVLEVVPMMFEALANGNTMPFDLRVREKLLMASMYAGMVIAQTGTTAVHAMGYSLTYFKDIDHGRANGLLLGPYLKLVQRDQPELVKSITDAMKVNCIEEYCDMMTELFGQTEAMTIEEIDQYSSKAMGTGNIKNCVVTPTQDELTKVYKEAFAL